jgi:hypothetical protein
VPRSMKEYVIGRLLYVGNALGISLGVWLAEVVGNVLDATSLEAMKVEDEREEGRDDVRTRIRGLIVGELDDTGSKQVQSSIFSQLD